MAWPLGAVASPLDAGKSTDEAPSRRCRGPCFALGPINLALQLTGLARRLLLERLQSFLGGGLFLGLPLPLPALHLGVAYPLMGPLVTNHRGVFAGALLARTAPAGEVV